MPNRYITNDPQRIAQWMRVNNRVLTKKVKFLRSKISFRDLFMYSEPIEGHNG